MPELPEVETVCKILKPLIVNKKITKCDIFYRNLIKSDLNSFQTNIINKTILDVSRVGKFIKISLENDFIWLVHLRMEGKFFHFSEYDYVNHNHSDSAVFLLDDGSFLVFNDTRKFGVMHLIRKGEEDKSPLNKVGPDPFMIDGDNINQIYKKITSKNIELKRSLTDQEIMSGLGNIYVDEVLFACELSPFMKSKELSFEKFEEIIRTSKQILAKAIDNKGSTIGTFHPQFNDSGEFQNFLKVYGRQGEKCFVCSTKIEKRFLNKRGTSFCPHCQNIQKSLVITGNIASGKSTALEFFNSKGCIVLSCDKLVHELYKQPSFIKLLAKEFPQLINSNNELDTNILVKELSNPLFNKTYQSFLYPIVKEKVNDFLNKNFDKKVVVEVPLLFESNMINLFSYSLGILSKRQKENLFIRGDKNKEQLLEINKQTMFDNYKHRLDFLLDNNESIETFKDKLLTIYNKIWK